MTPKLSVSDKPGESKLEMRIAKYKHESQGFRTNMYVFDRISMCSKLKSENQSKRKSKK
jgi:hypothetical protein